MWCCGGDVNQDLPSTSGGRLQLLMYAAALLKPRIDDLFDFDDDALWMLYQPQKAPMKSVARIVAGYPRAMTTRLHDEVQCIIHRDAERRRAPNSATAQKGKWACSAAASVPEPKSSDSWF